MSAPSMSLVDADLLRILACPACRSPLGEDVAAGELVCGGCARAYPVRDGIPILLIDEARLPGGAPDTASQDTASDGSGREGS